MTTFDTIIIGGGPAGLTAGLYAARAGRSAAIIERMFPGGQAVNEHRVDNYPGVPGQSGMAIADAMRQSAEDSGALLLSNEVVAVDYYASPKAVTLAMKHEGQTVLYAHAVVLATGGSPRMLGLPGETELTGRGISYCATCDGAFFRGKTVAVIGGGNVALGDAVYLAHLCDTVYLVHRRDTWRADSAVQRELLPHIESGKVVPVYNAIPTALLGDKSLTGVEIRDVQTGDTRTLDVAGCFVAIGYTPNNALCDGIQCDSDGYILTDEQMRTNIPGVYAAGDIRQKHLRQIITAAADGAVAAFGG